MSTRLITCVALIICGVTFADPDPEGKFKPTIEKTVALYRISNGTIYAAIEKLASTRPKYPPDVAVGIGSPLAECRIYDGRRDEDFGKSYGVALYMRGFLRIVEIVPNADGSEHLHRTIGMYQSDAVWLDLKREVMRQSDEIKRQKEDRNDKKVK